MINQEEIFGAALGLQSPWYISKIEFNKFEEGKYFSGELHLYIEFEVGSKFLDKAQGQLCPIHDTVERTWRHSNFFQHTCYLHCWVPRIITTEGLVEQVQVPWARASSSFTLLFEAMAMMLVNEGMSLSAAGRTVEEDGRVIGRIMDWYVQEAINDQPLEQAKMVGIDEVSSKKGHNYLTILTDSKERKVIGIGVGKDVKAVEEALKEMEKRGAQREHIEKASIDLSPAYTSAVLKKLPNAQIVYDRFHLEQLLSKAVDEVRKIEQVEANELKKSKFIWLTNKINLTERQTKKIHYLSKCFPSLGKAYQLKERFKQIWNNAYHKPSLRDFKKWIKMAERSKIQPIIKFINTLKSHMSGIVTYFKSLITNAFAEQINSSIQQIKRIARGYRNMENFKTMIYFKLGKLVINPLNMA